MNYYEEISPADFNKYRSQYLLKFTDSEVSRLGKFGIVYVTNNRSDEYYPFLFLNNCNIYIYI